MSDSSQNNQSKTQQANGQNNSTANKSGDYTRIHWNPPGSDRDDEVSTKNATLALKTAIAVARAFDANCALRNPAKECTVPMFEPSELVLNSGDSLRSNGFFTDKGLRGIKLTRNLQHGEFSEEEEEFRERFAERSIDGHYAVKFLQKGIYNSVHAASAASDMMMETKILMNLAPHPNICQIYGVTAAGSDAFLSRGKEGFYIILDRLKGTLVEQLEEWRTQQRQDLEAASKKVKSEENDKALALHIYQGVMKRLEMALDIASALLFLSDRQIVFHLRPDKVGFDVRYGRIKLCDFGQARENGQIDQAPSLIKSDDIRILAYTAPEVLCQAPVTVAADVYSYGMVLWEMLSLEHLYPGMSRAEHFERVVMNGERPELLPMIPKVIADLVSKCWDPYLRPTMKKVYDTVEETLLFQDDKPDMSLLPVLHRPPVAGEDLMSGSTNTHERISSGVAKPKRQLRRTKTEETPYTSSKEGRQQRRPRRTAAETGGSHHQEGSREMNDKSDDGGGRMRDKSRSEGGRRSREKRSDKNGEKPMGDKSRNENERPSRDRSSKDVMRDKSRNNDESLKDRSRVSNHGTTGDASGRVSHARRSRNTKSSSGHDTNKAHRSSHHKSSDHMKDRSRKSSSHGDSSSNMNMQDDSRESQGPIKDRSGKSRDRISRKSRASSSRKVTSEGASKSARNVTAEVQSTSEEKKS